jgi:hypothetical protein
MVLAMTRLQAERLEGIGSRLAVYRQVSAAHAGGRIMAEIKNSRGVSFVKSASTTALSAVAAAITALDAISPAVTTAAEADQQPVASDPA